MPWTLPPSACVRGAGVRGSCVSGLERQFRMIRAATSAGAPVICAIYNHYVTGTIVSFEEMPVTAGEMSKRMAAAIESLPWLVLESDDAVAGEAYAAR